MNYLNPFRPLDANGDPVSVISATIPGVTADHTETTSGCRLAGTGDHNCETHGNVWCRDRKCPDFGDPDFGEGTCPADHALEGAWASPRHPDGERARGYTADDLTAQEADRANSRCCENHDPVAEDIQCCDDCPDELPTRVIDTAPTIVIDMWEANQRELERRVATGEPLPEGADGRVITAEQVAAWRAERGPGEIQTEVRAIQMKTDDVGEIGGLVAQGRREALVLVFERMGESRLNASILRGIARELGVEL